MQAGGVAAYREFHIDPIILLWSCVCKKILPWIWQVMVVVGGMRIKKNEEDVVCYFFQEQQN